MLKSFKSIALYLLVVSLCCASFSLSRAAPVTFRFQATVGPLGPGNGDVSLPFTLVEGSVIDGRLTIDPALGEPPVGNASKSIQPHKMTLAFEGYSFGAEQYQTNAVNDSAIIEFGGNVILADFVAFSCSSSSIDVACSSQQLEFPDTLPLTFGMSTTFAGDPSLLPEPTLPSDIDVWNGFSIARRMRIGFSTTTGIGDIFDTTLSSFSLVPEPSSASIVLIGSSLLYLCIGRYKAHK